MNGNRFFFVRNLPNDYELNKKKIQFGVIVWTWTYFVDEPWPSVWIWKFHIPESAEAEVKEIPILGHPTTINRENCAIFDIVHRSFKLERNVFEILPKHGFRTEQKYVRDVF